MISLNSYERDMENIYERAIVNSFMKTPRLRINPILEETWRQLRSQMDDPRRERSKKLKGSYYKKVLNSKGWIKFETPSQYTPGKRYYQYIKLLDMKDIEDLKDLSTKEAIRLLMHGDISVYCSCPDFKYFGLKYLANQVGYGIYKEDRFPGIRNPTLEGTVCKHLGLVLSVFMQNWTKIHRDLKKTKYFMDKWDD